MISSEIGIRLGAFIAILIAMALWEGAQPRRNRSFSRLRRWPSNLTIAVLNGLLVRILLPATAVSLALVGESKGWGLLNNLPVSRPIAIAASLIVLDAVVYLQHVMFHAVPALWRVPRMHHADLDFDVTTGARFHPIEILLSMLVKFAAVVALGTPAAGVLIFEVLLNATSMFNHANVGIPVRLDRYLRWLVVTPDMHRVHHSILVDETNSNFGFNLPWWDRLLGTYRDQPAAGHDAMTIGIEQFRDARELGLDRMLLQPFRGPWGGLHDYLDEQSADPIRRSKDVPLIDVAALRGRLEAGDELALIDVRGADEFAGPLGHIAGAKNIPLAELPQRIGELAALQAVPIVAI